MSNSVHMGHMSWIEFRDAVKRDPVVFLPVGSVEQHGPHLPLTVDTIVPTAIAEAAAVRVGGIVAPPFGYGYKSFPQSGGGSFFDGTLNLDANSLVLALGDVIREFYRHGLRRYVVAVGHWENTWPANEVIDLAMRELADDDVRMMRYEYWSFVTPEMSAEIFPEGHPGMEFEHAGVMETSLMLTIQPELVKLDQLPDHPPATKMPYDMWPPHREWVTESGALCSARTSSAEKGAFLLDRLGESIGAAVASEF
jgi:creatinine amidohydrolase